MSEQQGEFVIRRILVALDASAHSVAALETAVDLAARMQAELLGLFVEDVNLLRLAALPFAREIRYPSAAEEPLDFARMERELRMQGERARQGLAAAAERAQVRWSFRVVRGQVKAEVSAAASEADLLAMGKASRSLTRQVRLGSTALAALTSVRCASLLVQNRVPFSQPVLVVYDGSKGARHALGAALLLAKADECNLTVLILAGLPADAQRLEEQVGNLIKGREVKVRYRRLHKADGASLVRAVRSEGSGLLVLSGESPLLREESIQRLLDDLNNPVLVVR